MCSTDELQKASFFQLAGHKECFKMGVKEGTILKLSTGNEEVCLRKLSNDELSPFVPKVYGTRVFDGETYLEMQDLLANFSNASVMDVKMGCRTYREEELGSALLRHDMYNKMIEVDSNEPTDEERKDRAITKPRYMIWRETLSSTASLGFRIEGMRLIDGSVDKNFKTVKEEDQISEAFRRYAGNQKTLLKYINRMEQLKQVLLVSEFFWSHEILGSSLLFVHDDNEANIWLIDFAKTYPLPQNIRVSHRKYWQPGNYEDGYLIGLDNLIRLFKQTLYEPSPSKRCTEQNGESIKEPSNQFFWLSW